MKLLLINISAFASWGVEKVFRKQNRYLKVCHYLPWQKFFWSLLQQMFSLPDMINMKAKGTFFFLSKNYKFASSWLEISFILAEGRYSLWSVFVKAFRMQNTHGRLITPLLCIPPFLKLSFSRLFPKQLTISSVPLTIHFCDKWNTLIVSSGCEVPWEYKNILNIKNCHRLQERNERELVENSQLWSCKRLRYKRHY